MAVTQCGNGHIYDPDIYPSCPYCNGSQPIINFGGTPVGSAGPTMGPKNGFGGTPVGSAGPTMGPKNGFGGTPVGSAGPTLGPKDSFGGIPAGGVGPTVGPKTGYSGGGVPVGDSSVTLPPRTFTGGASGGERRIDAENKTRGPFQKKLGIDPVVGWLVCVNGADKGKDYRLLGRINSIGRGENMDICIKGDMTISSSNHAKIGYGDKNNRFTLIPADGRSVIYLNGDEVYTPTVLKAYDVIEIGETTLVFIPFCSDQFTWQKGKTDGKGGDDGAV